MSVTAQWDNPDSTTLRFRFSYGWTWEEFRDTLAEADSLLKSVDQSVDVIIDLSGGATILPMANHYVQLVLEWIPAYWKTVVVVSRSVSAIAPWIDVQPAYRKSGRSLYLADSVVQARSLLAIQHGISPLKLASPA